MNVVLTFEGVWVCLFVIDSFHLDSCMVQVVFSSEQIGNLRKSLKWLNRLNMTGHRNFANGNGPDM